MESNAHSPAHRIALISGGLPLGGAAVFLLNLAGELVRRGIAVEVFSFEKDNPLAADFQSQHIPLFCLDERRMIFEDRLAVVLRRLREFRPTVVIANLGATSFEVLRYLPGGIFRMGVIHSDNAIQYKLVGRYVPWMDVTAVVSQAMKHKAGTLPEFSRAAVAYLPLGVPMCPDAALTARDFAKTLHILYLGRLGRGQKRVHLFPKIFSQLCAGGMPFHWTIAGEGEERGFLEANLKAVSPAQTVSFAGKISYAEVPQLLRTHDVYLLASDYEGLPLSLLEAMGAGLVPVVSDLPSGIPEVVNKTNGILVPVNDVEGYARGIIHLHQHRDELEKKSAAARERVKKEFSGEAMTDRWLAIFPKTFPETDEWPSHWKIKAPLPSRHPVYFSPPMRVLRRWAVRLR